MSNRSKKDHLSNKVSINAKLTETGFSAETRSRTASAIDRLVGSLIDVPIAYLENLSDTTRAKGQVAKAKLLSTISNGQDSEMEAKLMNLIADKQTLLPFINKLHVIEKTLEELGSKAETGENTDSDQEVDPDWLKFFGGYAEKASSETARARWAQVLAGEIRKPGTFSKRALRCLAEVDQETAEAFAEIVRLRFCKDNYILRPDINSYRGDFLSGLRLVEQWGLVGQTSPIGGVEWPIRDSENKGFISVIEGNFCLRIHSPDEVNIKVIT